MSKGCILPRILCVRTTNRYSLYVRIRLSDFTSKRVFLVYGNIFRELLLSYVTRLKLLCFRFVGVPTIKPPAPGPRPVSSRPSSLIQAHQSSLRTFRTNIVDTKTSSATAGDNCYLLQAPPPPKPPTTTTTALTPTATATTRTRLNRCAPPSRLGSKRRWGFPTLQRVQARRKATATAAPQSHR